MVINDLERFRYVLSGVSYPARTWQLWAAVSAYGADAHVLETLSRLPVAVYESPDAVLTVVADIERRRTT